ncbi:hypothetical protein SDC9_208596 [bioreactor metagenome]|uniref:Uncharacterized protein n=1 Tax=bioreactor metagenome TaxID=1076179 RepID=A0A645JML3_9ZZZZ
MYLAGRASRGDGYVHARITVYVELVPHGGKRHGGRVVLVAKVREDYILRTAFRALKCELRRVAV